MISDEAVRRLYLGGQEFLARNGNLQYQSVMNIENTPSQFFRGKTDQSWDGQIPGACERHLFVFDNYNVIPRYCFDCYKVLVEPRTVVDLFKLMVLFQNVKLKNDNTRKCMVEAREECSGAYKGYVYCRGLDEGRELLDYFKNAVSVEISDGIGVSLKRGCSEFSVAYPEYAVIGDSASMEYREEWSEREEEADKAFPGNEKYFTGETNNHPGFTAADACVMHAWLRYAATIGDLTYLIIAGKAVPRFVGLERSFTIDEEDGG